jgi:hypothetical protein
MNSYNLYRETEREKYRMIEIIRKAGATLTGVSACGTGYYIQVDATPEQADTINNMIDAEV